MCCLCFRVYGECIYQGLLICHAPRLHFPISNETAVDRQEFPPYEHLRTPRQTSMALIVSVINFSWHIAALFLPRCVCWAPSQTGLPTVLPPRNGTTKRREMGESRVYIFEGVLQVTSLRFVVPFSRPTQAAHNRHVHSIHVDIWTYTTATHKTTDQHRTST